MLARDQAQLEGAQRDVRRYSDLIGKGATTQVNLDNAKTQADILIGTIKADQSALDNLKVQKSYTTIHAPFSGRISAANVKVGNFVRPADTCRSPSSTNGACLCDLRNSAARAGRSPRGHGGRRIQGGCNDPGPSAIRAGQGRDGRELVDSTTGMVTVRGIMNNERETLWPGSWSRPSSSSARRIPWSCRTVAVQRSQNGNYVFRGQGWRGQGPAGEGRPNFPRYIR